MPSPTELSWLRDAVVGKNKRSLLFVSANPLSCTDPQFWRTLAHPELFRSSATALAQEGRKVVFVTDAENDPARRHYLGLQLANALAREGKQVLLVDGELDGDGFTAGLPAADREGWADLVLYGASPEATVFDSPVEGVRVLGAGSLRPSPGLALDVAALERGVERLRKRFDAVFIVSGARRASDAWNELLGICDGLVLATTPDAPRVEQLLEHLHEHRVPLWGAAVFGSETQAVELTVDNQFKEKTRAVSPYDLTVDGKPIRNESGSSAGFRWAAIVAVVLLVAFGGWWWFAKDPGGAESVQQSSMTPPAVATPTTDDTPADAAIETDAPAEAEEVQAVDGGADAAPARIDEVFVEDFEEQGATDAASVVQEEPSRARTTEQAATTPPPVSTPPTPEPEPSVETVEELASFSDPLLLSPGGGWSLHPWSFPDSAEALAALVPLERDGMKPRVLGFDLEGKGRWFRVLVGRYESRAAATEERSRLSARRGIDWVGVVRVP